MNHNNPSIAHNADRLLNLKGEFVSEVFPMIMPTVEVLPKIDIIKVGSRTTTGTSTLYTTPAGKDFYLVGYFYNCQKDAANDMTNGTIDCTIMGAAAVLYRMNFITLTADSRAVSMIFPIPIKIDRNTAITFSHTVGAGNATAAAGIFGYEVEVTKSV